MWNPLDEVKGRQMATTGTQALDRAALLVSTVVQAGEPISFADLQEACDLPKSTTSRMLTALERSDLLERTDDGSYVAGGLFWLYAARHDPGEDLVRLAGPMLQALGEATHETVTSAWPAASASSRSPRSTRSSCSAPATGPRSTSPRTAPRSARSSWRGTWSSCRPARWRRPPRRASPTAPRCAPTSRAPAPGAGRSPSTSSRSGSPGSPYPSAARATRWSPRSASRAPPNDSRPGSTSWAGC